MGLEDQVTPAQALMEAAQPIHPPPTSFWRRYVFSVDHKVIAKQFLWAGLLFLLVGGTLAMLIRWQRAEHRHGPIWKRPLPADEHRERAADEQEEQPRPEELLREPAH